MSRWRDSGFQVFPEEIAVAQWANAAHQVALDIVHDPAMRADNLRHGNTWFVGVDALPNHSDGSINGVPLTGAWQARVALPVAWHRAQLSVVYPGYPIRDQDETEAAHRFRCVRHAAHVDGLLPEGPHRRRYLRECHAFILGLPLNDADAAPLMLWPGSHVAMGNALRAAIGGQDPVHVDLTDAYQAARRAVFDCIEPVAVVAKPGQAILLHRHLLHGVAAFGQSQIAPPEGRMIAYLRPEFANGAEPWLAEDPPG